MIIVVFVPSFVVVCALFIAMVNNIASSMIKPAAFVAMERLKKHHGLLDEPINSNTHRDPHALLIAMFL